MKLKQWMLTALAIATLLLVPAATQADPLVFDNPPPVVVTGRNTSGLISISIRNSGPGLLTILGADFGGFTMLGGVGDPGIDTDLTPFFINFLDLQLLESGSLSGGALGFTIGPNVAYGTYVGQFTIFYDGLTPGQSVSQDFTVQVVPEPTTMLLLGTGLVGAAGARFRKRWRSKTQ